MCMCVYTEKTNNSAAAKQPENVSVNMVNREQKDSLVDRYLPVKDSLVNGGLQVKGAYCCVCVRGICRSNILQSYEITLWKITLAKYAPAFACRFRVNPSVASYSRSTPRVGSGAVRIGPTPFPDRR